jgi:hypothetical protein
VVQSAILSLRTPGRGPESFRQCIRRHDSLIAIKPCAGSGLAREVSKCGTDPASANPPSRAGRSLILEGG